MSRVLWVRKDCPYNFLCCLGNFIPEDDLVFRRHVKVAALGVYGCPTADIAAKANYTQQHVCRVLHDYNFRGFFALFDGRRKYDLEEVRTWFTQTANYIDMSIDACLVKSWFEPAPELLSATNSTPQEEQPINPEGWQPANLEDSYPTDSNSDLANRESGLSWQSVCSLIILLFVFVSCMKRINHHNDRTIRQDNPIPQSQP